MKNKSLMLLMGTAAAEGVLWLLAPGLATVVGVVFGLSTIASWREGSRMRHPRACMNFNVDDFQRRSGASLS
jgi:hypothetical protein